MGGFMEKWFPGLSEEPKKEEVSEAEKFRDAVKEWASKYGIPDSSYAGDNSTDRDVLLKEIVDLASKLTPEEIDRAFNQPGITELNKETLRQDIAGKYRVN